MAYEFGADGSIINTEPTNPSVKKTNRERDDDEYSSILSGLAGVGSGLFKIPEEFISLGATLVDLGLGTNGAAAVEQFFDKINPFDDMAEATTTGKVVETLVSLGIPGTVGYKIGTKLARQAIQAKKIGKYADVTKLKAAKKGLDDSFDLDKLVKVDVGPPVAKLPSDIAKEGLDKIEAEALKKFNNVFDRLPERTQLKKNILEKSQLFGAGLGGGAIADFVFGDESIGTLGDSYGGPTKRDTAEEEGRGEAARLLTNRLKFAAEGAVFGSVIGGVGGAIGKATKEVKYTISKNAIDNKFKKIIAAFTPQGVNPRPIFEAMQNQKNEVGRFKTEGQAIARTLQRSAESLIKKSQKNIELKPGQKKEEQTQELIEELAGGVDDYLGGSKDRLNNIFNKLKIKDEEVNIFTKKIDQGRDIIDTYSNVILKVIPEGEAYDPLRKAIKENLGSYNTATYQVIERKNTAGQLFKDYAPGEAATKTAKNWFIGQINKGNIAREAGVSIEDQADRSLTNFLKNGIDSAQEAPLAKVMGISIEDGILKPKNLPNELKAFLGEVKNPYYKISSTIAKQGSLITSVEMLNSLSKLGKGKIFFNTAKEAENALGGSGKDIQKLSVNSEVFGGKAAQGGIGELYTTKEIADGFVNQVKGAQNGTVSSLYEFFVLTPKRLSQEAKTIFSPFTHARNLLSAGAFTLMNGNIDFVNPGRMKDAFKKSFSAFSKGKNSEEAFDLYLDYNRRGIGGTNTVIGELQELGANIGKVNEVDESLVMKTSLEKAAGGFQKLRQFITDKYMAEDDFWKIYNYNFEQGSYKGFVNNFLARSPENLGIKNEKQLSDLLKKAFNKEELLPNETQVLTQFQKKIGRLLGRKDITLDDPIFKRYSNASAGLRDIDPATGLPIINPRTGTVNYKDGTFLKDPATGQIYDRDLINLEDPVEALIKNLSADVTKNNIPNYSYVGDAIKSLRKLPLGTFVAFPAEIIRTGFNTIQRAARELSIAETRGIGMRRMAGVLGTGAALPVGAVELGKQLSGFTEDEMQALRRFVPSWSENSLLVPTGRDEDSGKIQYIDLSYIYPYDSLLRPARTVMNQLQEGKITDENIMTSLTEGGIMSMKELVKPFMSEAIYVEAMTDLLVRNGRTRENSQVFRPEDPIGEKLYKGTMHIVDTLTPGSIDQALRIGGAPFNVADKYGKTYDLGDEIGGIFGFRNIEVDPEQSFKFMISDFNKSISGARATFLGDALKGGAVTPNQVLNQYLGAEQSRYKAFQNMYKNVEAAEILGMKKNQIFNQLERLPKKTRNSILQGIYQPYVPSPEVRKLFYTNALALSRETGAPLIDPFGGAQTQISRYINDNWGNNLLDEPIDIDYSLPNLQDGIFEGLFQSTGPVTPANSAGKKVTPAIINDNNQAGLTPFEEATLDPISKQILLNSQNNQGNV